MAERGIHTEILIDAPRDRVWSVLADFSAYSEWNPFVTSVRGELKPGAELTVKIRLGSRTMKIRPTVLSVQAGRSFRWLGHTFVRGLFDGEHAFELGAEGNQRTRMVHSEKFGGVLSGAFLALLGTKTEQGFVAMNEALKQRCETPTESARSTA